MLSLFRKPLHKPAANRERGFTLIELLIVVIIIGILAAIALPIFLNQQKAANDGAVQSDVRNTVDSVQTFLVKNSGTAYANTGAYVTAGGAATISNGDTVGVNIGTDGSYQVCGYVTSGAGNQFKSASAAFTYTTSGTAAGTFATGACVSGSDTGGTTGAAASGSGAATPVVQVTYGCETGNDTIAGVGSGTVNLVRVTSPVHTGSYACGSSGGGTVANGGSNYEELRTASTYTFAAGTTYTLSAWIYWPYATAPTAFTIRPASGTFPAAATVPGVAQGWTQVTTTFVGTGAADRVAFGIQTPSAYSSVTWYADDISISK